MADYEMTPLVPRPIPTAYVSFCTDALPEPIQSYVRSGAKAMTCADSYVALAALLKQNPRGLLLCRDELAGWIKGFNSYKGGRGGDETAFLELHRAGTLLVDRKSGIPKTIHVPNAAVSVCGGIQPGILQQALGRENFENGLAARILMAMPPRIPKQWNDYDIDLDGASQVDSVFEELMRMEMAVDWNQKASPKVLHLNSEAQAAWIDFYNDHAVQQAEVAESDLAAAFSKLEGYAARLALVIHCVREADGDVSLAPDDYIDAESIHRAVRIVRWFCDETRRIYASFNETDEQAQQRKLLEIIRKHDGRITVRQLMHASRLYRNSADIAKFALDELAQLGWGRWDNMSAGEHGGRPSPVFILNTQTGGNKTPDTESAGGFVTVTAS